MSSSDSEDGYYSNVVKNMVKLREECMKKLQNESIELSSESGKSDAATNKAARNTVSTDKTTQSNIYTFNDSIEDTNFLDEIIAKNAKPAPRTRGRKKKETPNSNTATPTVPAATRGRGRGRDAKRGRAAKNNVTNTAINSTVDTVRNTALNSTVDTVELLNNLMGCDSSWLEKALIAFTGTRGGGRSKGMNRGSNGRARGGRGRGSRPTVSNLSVFPPSPLYPMFSVGNTDEYPDNSDDIPLFSKQKNAPTASINQAQPAKDDISNEEIENADDNEPLSVKVIWKSCQAFKFTIRKYQKITQIFEKFAKQENVGVDNLLFMYNDKILTSNDTPASIDYNIAKFIDGGVVSHSVSLLNGTKSKVNGINIKFQGQNKNKIELMIGKEEKLSLAMTQCAERLGIPLNKLKFEFDGDTVSGSSTPQQLGMEDGDCIDVVILG